MKTLVNPIAQVGIVALALVVAPVGAAKVSHNGWPKINGKFVIHSHNETKPIHGTAKHDKLLGGNGSDTIYGGPQSDVLWASYDPNQPTNVVDRIWGGGGGDYIYAGHGFNHIYGGRGDDYIHAHYGGGIVDCGPGRDLVYFSHKRRKHWKQHGCERITYHAGTTTLTPNG